MLQNKIWWVYAAECRDGSIYVGSTENVAIRIEQHNAGRGGLYTRNQTPLKLIWKESHQTRELAVRREFQIKGWTRLKKRALFHGDLELLKKL